MIDKLKDIHTELVPLVNEFMYLGSMQNMGKMIDILMSLTNVIDELENGGERDVR